jgi:hypothetical protein
MTRSRAPLRSALLVLAAATLGGCASLDRVDSEVTSHSKWPPERRPGTYAFERLPSQQANPQRAQVLEDAARRAIEGAGFVPAAEGARPNVAVQIGARITVTDRGVWDDPFWYGGWGGAWGFSRPFHPRGYWGPGRFGGWGGWGGWGPWGGPGYHDRTTHEREVAVLIRDKASGEPLWESSATGDGFGSADASVLPAMFEAAMQGFPQGGPTPRRVSVQPAPAAPAASAAR